MLEGLEQVDWPHLTHAYGPADDVPALIEALTSVEDEEQEEALEELMNCLVHQGSVVEATAYAVPFLIDLLQHQHIHHKERILELLFAISCGSSAIPAGDSYAAGLIRRQIEQRGLDYEAQARRAMQYVTAAHRAVTNGLPVYLQLLESGDRLVRFAAAEILPGLDELHKATPQVVGVLASAIPGETDEDVRAQLYVTLGGILSQDSNGQLTIQYTPLLLDRLASDPSFLARFGAAIGLAGIRNELTEPAAPEIVAVLLDYKKLEVPAGRRAAEPLFMVSDSLMVDALRKLHARHAVPALTLLLTSLEPHQAPMVVEALLEAAFGKPAGLESSGPEAAGLRNRTYRIEPDVEPVQRLSQAQSRALRAIVANDAAWQSSSNLWEVYGLPSRREDLRELVEGRTGGRS